MLRSNRGRESMRGTVENEGDCPYESERLIGTVPCLRLFPDAFRRARRLCRRALPRSGHVAFQDRKTPVFATIGVRLAVPAGLPTVAVSEELFGGSCQPSINSCARAAR